MYSIWVKMICGEKSVRDIVYECPEKFSEAGFDETVREICSVLDIPTPLILNSHKKNFKNFNRAVFKKSEFVESVYFDALSLEYLPSDKKKAECKAALDT